jgi:hypothetical protein
MCIGGQATNLQQAKASLEWVSGHQALALCSFREEAVLELKQLRRRNPYTLHLKRLKAEQKGTLYRHT